MISHAGRRSPFDGGPNRADLGKDPASVSGMFDQVAAKYDVTNTVLSVGNDRLWRVATTRAVRPRPGERILDLAAGTGASSISLARSGAHVVAADFSPGMIAEGRRRYRDVRNLEFVEADATALPFADGEFDAVTMSFGLRNVKQPKKALAELLRVTKPGGRLVICEFSHPPAPAIRGLYRFYNDRILPRIARVVSSNTEAYDYLNESIRHWPDQRALSAWIREVGWTDVAYRDLSFGIVALHRAVKPAQPGAAPRSFDAEPEGRRGEDAAGRLES
ncbi:demethylmenaquinone methyltransferase [Microbacterium paludicola]|uniref:demethylmenaquinone methyltransferase n=1 Tax=Microbacterium paludicola TaxID=300019 RepID=UPI003879DF21